MQNDRFRFAEKPGVLPGKPIVIGDSIESNRANDMKHVARIEGRRNRVDLDYRRVTKTGAALVIGACDTGAASKGRFTQDGRTFRFHVGGAY